MMEFIRRRIQLTWYRAHRLLKSQGEEESEQQSLEPQLHARSRTHTHTETGFMHVLTSHLAAHTSHRFQEERV